MTQVEIKESAGRKLYPGKRVQVTYYSLSKGYAHIPRKKKVGTVTALYPYIFTVDFGRYKESFRYDQIFIKSQEVVKV